MAIACAAGAQAFVAPRLVPHTDRVVYSTVSSSHEHLFSILSVTCSYVLRDAEDNMRDAIQRSGAAHSTTRSMRDALRYILLMVIFTVDHAIDIRAVAELVKRRRTRMGDTARTCWKCNSF